MRLRSFFDLIRADHSIMTSVAVVIGSLAGGANLSLAPVVYAAISAFLIAGSSFAINDLCDQELDEASARSNPLTKGDVLPNQAAAIAVSFSVGGVYVSTLTGSNIAMSLALVSALLAIAYSVYLKPYQATIGHLATSYSTGITYIYGWSAFSPERLSAFSAVFFMFAVTMTANFSRELIKGIADQVGDMKWGIRTPAVTRGPRFAATAGLAVMVVAVGISYLPLVFGVFRTSYVVIVTLANILLVLLVGLVQMRPTPETAARVKSDILKVMFIGLIAFLVGPHFEFYSMFALPFEALAVCIFAFLLLRGTWVRSLWHSAPQ